MIKYLIFFALPLFIDPPGGTIDAACRGDLSCQDFITVSCAVPVPVGGFCNISRSGWQIFCQSYDSDSNPYADDEARCAGIAHGDFCDPAQPWWECQPEWM